MLKISATKGIWTLDEVIKMLQDANIEFRAVISNDAAFDYEISQNVIDINRKQAEHDASVLAKSNG